jgi:hypothetical protein
MNDASRLKVQLLELMNWKKFKESGG